MATQGVVENLTQVAAKSNVGLALLAEQGLPLESIDEVRARGLTFTEVGLIVVPPRTLKHRKARGERLSTEESERLLRVVRILTLADKIFGDHEKALRWLRMPDDRWNDHSGLTLLRTEAGGRLVENTLWQIDDGIYP